MLQLRIYLENYWETQDDELTFVNYESHFTKEAPSNIYFVGSRPRVIIDENYIEINNNFVRLLFKVQEGNSYKEIYGNLKLNRQPQGQLQLETKFPFSRFNIKDDIGYLFDKPDYPDKYDVKIKASYALRSAEMEGDTNFFSDFKVLYIGKSLKMHGIISPVKRIQSHPKIQTILNKCVREYIDKEIYIILCSFVYKIDLLAAMEELQSIGDSDQILQRIRNDLRKLNKSQELMTHICEAALIDFFNTKEFNSDFIGSFGRSTHSYYKPIISSKLDTISVEIDFTKLCRIYSDSVEPNSDHSLKYYPKDNFRREIT